MNKLPLRFELLNYFGKVESATINECMRALEKEYGKERQFKKSNFIDHVLTMKENGLVDEGAIEIDENGELAVYYSINDYGIDLRNKYIAKSKR